MSASAEHLPPPPVPAPPPPQPEVQERQSDVEELPAASRIDLLERAWRFFCSLKLMVVLMALFALGMAAGTFLNPKEDALVEIERAFANRPAIVWLYRTFELYAPFKSWWFTTVIVLLALNNLASSIERLPRIFLIVRNPERKLTDLVLRGLRNKRSVPRGSLDADRIEGVFAKAGYKVSRVVEDGVTYLFGERGAWTRFGVWVVHLALLLICLGGIIHALFAFEGTMMIPDGGGVRASFQEKMPDGTIIDHPLSFAIRCNKFYLDKFKDGSPRRYASDLDVLDKNFNVIGSKQIIVNDPLEWDGMKFYQATYSERPDQSQAIVTLTDTKSNDSKEFKATPSHPFSLGDGTVRYTVVNYEKDFADLGPAVQVLREEGPANAPPDSHDVKQSSFWVFSNYPDFDAKYRGDRYGLKFDKLVPSYVTGIQVARDPGVKVVYAGCILVWIGLFVTFWTAHRRVWARIEDDRVTLAGAAHRNKEKFKEQFDALADGLVGAKKA